MKSSETRCYNQFLATLACESRLAILARLAGREMTVTKLAEDMNISLSAVSHHLATLRWAELVQIRREGRWTFYTANVDCINICCRRLFDQLNVKLPALEQPLPQT